MTPVLDPRLTFERLRIGPGNRGAVDAIRRAVEAPNGGPDTLVVHGQPGTGKTHLLVAAAHLARSALPNGAVQLHSLAEWAVLGDQRVGDELNPPGSAVELLLLDDVDALAGEPGAQLELLRALGLAQRGGARVIATCATPPNELHAIDPRIRERLAAGRAVHLAAPDETAGPTTAAESVEDEFGTFLSDITSTVAELVEAAPWRRILGEAIRHWEGEGFRTRRMEAALDAADAPDVDALVTAFAADAQAILRIERELAEVDPDGAQARPARDPDRRAEAEDLLRRAHAAPRPAPAPVVDRWFFNPEKVALDWVGIEERIVEELG